MNNLFGALLGNVFDPKGPGDLVFSDEFKVFLYGKFSDEFKAQQALELERQAKEAEEESKKNAPPPYDLEADVLATHEKLKAEIEKIFSKHNYKPSRYKDVSKHNLSASYPPYCFRTQETVEAWERITDTVVNVLGVYGDFTISNTGVLSNNVTNLTDLVTSHEQRLKEVEQFQNQLRLVWDFFKLPRLKSKSKSKG